MGVILGLLGPFKIFKMKKVLIYIVLLITASVHAQSIQRQVISPIGGVQNSGDIILSATVGQPIAGTIGEEKILNQGFQQNLTATQDIELREGWGMLSLNVKPFKQNLVDLFDVVEDDLIVLKNNDAEVYITEYNFNGIGDWDFNEGYQYKMNNESEISIRGSRIIPQLNPINLVEGWNMLAYLRREPASISSVMYEIVEDVILIKDENGNIFIPEFNFDGIGDMSPGKGYQIKVYTNTSLQYLPNGVNYE